MSYEFYKIIHIASIVLFFSGFAAATVLKQRTKLWTILTGVALLTLFISGFGLVMKLGISHGGGWPLWLNLKLAIWFIVGVGGHIVLKRFPQFSNKMYWLAFVGLIAAAYLANYKIS